MWFFCHVFKMHAAVKVARAINIRKMSRGISLLRGVQIPGSFQLNFVCLTLLSMECAFLTPFSLSRFDEVQIYLEYYSHARLRSSLTSAGDGGYWPASRLDRFHPLTLTLRMSYIYIYIYGAPILDVSRSHTTTHHSR